MANILLFIKNKEERERISNFLKIKNHNVVFAESSSASFDLLFSNKEINIVIVEIREKKELDFLTTAKKIREKIQIIITTPSPELHSDEKVLDIIEYPTDFKKLNDCLKKALENIGEFLLHGNVLLVDDNKELTDLLTNLLEEENYRVVVFSDLEKVIDKVKNEYYDLILIDLHFPTENIEIVKKIHTLSPKSYIILIIAGGKETEKEIRDMLGVHHIYYEILQKPFDYITLLLTLRYLQKKSDDYRNFASLPPTKKIAKYIYEKEDEIKDRLKEFYIKEKKVLSQWVVILILLLITGAISILAFSTISNFLDKIYFKIEQIEKKISTSQDTQ